MLRSFASDSTDLVDTKDIKVRYTMPRTWHPHIYDSTPKQPTPHFIENILGVAGNDSDEKHTEEQTDEHEQTISPKDQTLKTDDSPKNSSSQTQSDSKTEKAINYQEGEMESNAHEHLQDSSVQNSSSISLLPAISSEDNHSSGSETPNGSSDAEDKKDARCHGNED